MPWARPSARARTHTHMITVLCQCLATGYAAAARPIGILKLNHTLASTCPSYMTMMMLLLLTVLSKQARIPSHTQPAGTPVHADAKVNLACPCGLTALPLLPSATAQARSGVHG